MTLEIIIILIASGLFILYMLSTRGRRDDALALIDGWARNNQCAVVSAQPAPFWTINAFVLKHAGSGIYRVTFRDQRGDLIHGWASCVPERLLDDAVLEVKLDW
ncbi:MAG TPA: hypothetical protein VD886_06920 [Herpetosiphonaceae bacterium]|nr:hypothetical protein [Herpetosiphonaceae bacterium]